MKITESIRNFKWNSKELPDPDPALSPAEVVKYYAGQFPELVNGYVKEDKIEESDDKMVVYYQIQTNVGTKG